MDSFMLLWSVISAQWAALVTFAAWTAHQHSLIHSRISKIDKIQSTRLASIDEKLAAIDKTLTEIKSDMKRQPVQETPIHPHCHPGDW